MKRSKQGSQRREQRAGRLRELRDEELALTSGGVCVIEDGGGGYPSDGICNRGLLVCW